ncbi:MAG: tetratricopeptide repeat protein [Polyangiaceae bacterium]
MPDDSEPTQHEAPLREAPPRSEENDGLGANFDGEDFLFHLYRGSELLQDNRIEEAKTELETALGMQPRDIEGQGLLGVVYFRLGMYPHAMEIYEELVRACPREVTPRINLALCYLKTGQLLQARSVLEQIIGLVPEHQRAWGYLGLVFERLGDHAKAQVAFERAAQPHLARRMQHILEERSRIPGESQPPDQQEMMSAAADAEEELDRNEDAFSIAGSNDGATSRSGRWRAIELGQERLPPPSRPFSPVSLTPSRPPRAPSLPPTSARGGAPTLAGGVFVPPPVDQLAEESLLVFSEEPRVVGHADGVVLVNSEERFCLRPSAVRAVLPIGNDLTSRQLKRRSRGRETDELLGDAGDGIIELLGPARLVLGSPEGRLVVTQLDGQFLYLRERLLVAFESGIAYESGRLPVSGERHEAVVQLSGQGAVVFNGGDLIEALDCRAEQPVWIAAEFVVGWTGRLLPRPLDPSEALGVAQLGRVGGSTGLISFSGDGAVFAKVR